MSKATEKRVRILPGAETQPKFSGPSPQPGRGVSSDYWKTFGGLTRYRCVGEDVNVQACNIIFPQSAYQTVVDHLSQDTSREHGGFLLGYEIYSSDSETPTVVIEQAVSARHTEGTPVRLTFTEETWRDLDEITDKYRELGRELQRVGWYHSHPNISIFLSHYDLDVCTIFDRRRYPIALVVDPVKKRGGFFVRGEKGYAPQSAQGFYELHDVQSESVVKLTNVTRASPPSQVRPAEPVTGGASRPPIRIDDRKDRSGGLRPSVLRIAISVLVCLLLGAVIALLVNQQQMASHVDQLTSDVNSLSAQVRKIAAATPASQGLGNSNVPPADSAPTKVDLRIEPPSVKLRPGEVQTFRLVGTGSDRARVTWTIQSMKKALSGGRIDPRTGDYTPPDEVWTTHDVKIIATFKSGKAKQAIVTLEAPSIGGNKPTSGTQGSSAGRSGGASTVKGQTVDGSNKTQPPSNGIAEQSTAKTPASQDQPIKKISDLDPTPTPTPTPTPRSAPTPKSGTETDNTKGDDISSKGGSPGPGAQAAGNAKGGSGSPTAATEPAKPGPGATPASTPPEREMP